MSNSNQKEEEAYLMPKLFSRPKSLCDLCLRCVCFNLDVISTRDENNNRRLIKGMRLPRFLCDNIVNFFYCRRHLKLISNDFFTIFENTDNTALKDISIDITDMSDETLEVLSKHKLKSLKVFSENEVGLKFLAFVNKNLKLEHLSFNSINNLISIEFQDYKYCRWAPRWPPKDGLRKLRSSLSRRGYILSTCSLRSLDVPRLDIMPKYYPLLFNGLHKLEHLDLSYISDLNHFKFYDLYPNLISLILHNCLHQYNYRYGIDMNEIINGIIQLKQLKHLDISYYTYYNNTLYLYENCDEILDKIVRGLPKLESLDISGTNLVGSNDFHELIIDGVKVKCGIRGLISRVDNPLEFINLTYTNASMRANIPAKKIGGLETRDQLINLAKYYINNWNPSYVLNQFRKFLQSSLITEANSIIVLLIIVELVEEYEDKICLKDRIAAVGCALSFVNTRKIPYEIKIRIIHISSFGIDYNVNHSEISDLHDLFELLFAPIKECFMSDYEIYINIFTIPLKSKNSSDSIQFQVLNKLEKCIQQLNETKKYLLEEKTNLIEIFFNYINSIIHTDFSVDKFVNFYSNFYYRNFGLIWGCLHSLVYKIPKNIDTFFSKNGIKFFSECLKKQKIDVDLLIKMLQIVNDVTENVKHSNLMQHHSAKNYVELLDSVNNCQVKFLLIDILTKILINNDWSSQDNLYKEIINSIINSVKSWKGFSLVETNFSSLEWLIKLVKINRPE